MSPSNYVLHSSSLCTNRTETPQFSSETRVDYAPLGTSLAGTKTILEPLRSGNSSHNLSLGHQTALSPSSLKPRKRSNKENVITPKGIQKAGSISNISTCHSQLLNNETSLLNSSYNCSSSCPGGEVITKSLSSHFQRPRKRQRSIVQQHDDQKFKIATSKQATALQLCGQSPERLFLISSSVQGQRELCKIATNLGGMIFVL